ncbi:hypothetical protein H4W80_010630 [Nonomuraea angiospora]|uniref:Uncharacterized protein n=1 Tax=Nonomuraea angiospora TaxID=46172 RepID=A0ABR9MHK5_9ACTN|nr:hypothetical protein [Nonomuraea angiospora]
MVKAARPVVLRVFTHVIVSGADEKGVNTL